MQDCKLVKVSISVGTKFSTDEFPKSQEEIEYMAHVTFANEVEILLYAMVDTRLDIAHVVGVLRKYMLKPVK